MSAHAPAAAETQPETQPGAQPGGQPAIPPGRDVWRSARAPVLIAVALLLIAALAALAQARTTYGYLDPEATGDAGSRALAELLRDRGVTVERVSTVAGAQRASSSEKLLVVTGSELLAAQQLERLAGLPGDRLLVAPGRQALDALAPGVTRLGRAAVKPRRPACGMPAARLAGTAVTGGERYRVAASRAQACYPAGDDGATLARVASNGRTVTVLGTGKPLMNANLTTEGNAALAMNLAGARSSVVWLVPGPIAASGGGQKKSLAELVPPAVPLAAVQLAVAVLVIALWRMRRLGPVVSERLPVVVRASETMEGRARLYRSRRARERAAEALRTGSRSRLVPRLGLAPGADVEAVVEAVAARIGWTPGHVGALLYGAPPADDSGLVRLADDLDALEREVRRL